MSQERQKIKLEKFDPSVFSEIEFKFMVEGGVNLNLEETKRYVHTLVVNHNDFDGWKGKVAQNILKQEFKNKICNLNKLQQQTEKSSVIVTFLRWYEDQISNEFIPSIINDTKPYTVKEAISNENTEIRLLVLSCFEAEDIVRELESELLDSQTIIKTQTETNILGSKGNYRTTLPSNFKSDQIVLGEKKFKDTYELYKVSKKSNVYQNDQFYVKMKDTTSDKTYYLWINPEEVNESKPDAIDAIASTVYTFDPTTLMERRVTKEEYLSIKEET